MSDFAVDEVNQLEFLVLECFRAVSDLVVHGLEESVSIHVMKQAYIGKVI